MKLKEIHLGCHGIPERCFKVQGKTMPFCARCLGASIGYLAGILLSTFLEMIHWYFLTIGLVIMLADWTLQNRLNVYQSNIARLFTGILGGFAVIGLMVILTRILIRII